MESTEREFDKEKQTNKQKNELVKKEAIKQIFILINISH